MAYVEGTVKLNEFLDKVHERVVDRASKDHIYGVARVGNIWRFNNAEATITDGLPSGEFLVTFRYGADASRSSKMTSGSADSTAEAILDNFESVTRSLV